MLKKVQAQLAVCLPMLALCTVTYGDAYVLLRVHATESSEKPRWLAISESRQIRTNANGLHVPLDDELILLEMGPGWYHLSHFDFTEDMEGDDSTFYLDARNKEPGFKFLVKQHTVLYFGDVYISAEQTRIEANVETVQLACDRYAELMARHEFLFHDFGAKSGKTGKPCADLQD